MKIIAVLNALRSPAFQAELGLTPSTGSSSPRDSETGYHMASETGSISSSMSGGSHDHHQDLAMPPPPPPPSWSQSETMPRDHNVSLNSLEWSFRVTCVLFVCSSWIFVWYPFFQFILY